MPLRAAAAKVKSLIVESVGNKLAGATFLVVATIAAASTLKVSHDQRESLLGGKEAAGSAVTRLFADSCAAPVIFEDAGAVNAALDTLGGNQDVEYAAVWAVDRSGRLTRQLGELQGGRTATPDTTSSATHFQLEPDRLVVTTPVHNPEGRVIARAVVAFSLSRERKAIASARASTLILASLAGLGVVGVLMALARLLIVKPLGKLVVAANELEKGGAGQVEVRTNDEVGKLARAFRAMASSIKVREARINARNRDVRLVLDNVGQGFITLDIDGVMSEERSRVIDAWFGPVAGVMPFWEYLGQVDAELSASFEVGWSAVREDFIPLDLALDQLPSLAHKDGKVFELAYRPIMEGEKLDKTVVVITDVTARLMRERAEREQREMMSLYRHAHSDPAALDQFFVEVSALVDAVVGWRDGDLSVLLRHIHTVKGNCALFGIESVSELCHELETWISDAREAILPSSKESLRSQWAHVTRMREQLGVGGASSSRVEIDRGEYAAFVAELRGHAPARLIDRMLTWPFEPVAQRLILLEKQVCSLAERLGKAPVDVIREPTDLRLPPRQWASFWSAFAHVVRNTVDHGVETADERAAAGKPARARVELGVKRDRQGVVVTIADDGHGIDWEAVASRARERGLPHGTRAELEMALFADGISTRAGATMTSGRGVGLGAILDVVVDLGGTIEIQTAPGKGTAFRFLLPESMLSDQDGEPGMLAPRERIATVAQG
jgi:HPt (histidine-containing phosphotransfer) domain-containing protein/HAMP domain-containing protein